jgi:hypothetical protein
MPYYPLALRGHCIPMNLDVRTADSGFRKRLIAPLGRKWLLSPHEGASKSSRGAVPYASACRRSSIRSSEFSIPTDMRIVPGLTPAALSSFEDILLWDV